MKKLNKEYRISFTFKYSYILFYLAAAVFCFVVVSGVFTPIFILTNLPLETIKMFLIANGAISSISMAFVLIEDFIKYNVSITEVL